MICFPALIGTDNPVASFLSYSNSEALKCIELPRGEFLLVFQTLGIYVDSQGRKSRDKEIMYPAYPIAVSKLFSHHSIVLMILIHSLVK